jgi:DNA polymerase-1
MKALTTIVDTQLSAYPVQNRDHGPEYCGACPWCKGTDRFHVWPQENVVPGIGPLGLFLCMDERRGRAGCGRSGDAISYLQQKRGLSFKQACTEIGVDVQVLLDYRQHQKDAKEGPSHSSGREPAKAEICPQWQENALNLAQWAQARLETEKEALDYLCERGLRSTTIHAQVLGYYPFYKQVNAQLWGYPPGKLSIPRGIVIPWFDEQGHVICMRFRRLPSDESEEARRYYGVDQKTGQIKRYRVLAGSSSQFLYLGATLTSEKNVALMEGELNALILAQESEALDIAVVATGSTGWGRHPRWLRRLAACSRVLVCYDADTNRAGDKAAKYWLSHLENARHWRPLWDDANEMKRDAVDLTEWLRVGLQDMEHQLTEQEEALDIPLSCHQCGISIEAKDRDFFYLPLSATSALLCCTKCYDLETQQPRQKSASGNVLAGDAVLSFLRDYPERFSTGARIALDLETTGLDRYQHKIVTVQLGVPGEVYILDVRAFYGLSQDEQQHWRMAFQHLFDTPDVTWLGHNLKFDWLFLAQHFGVKPEKTYDTMIAEQALHEGQNVKYSMEETAARYHIQVTKEEQKSTVDLDKSPAWNEPFRSELIAYMVQDVEAPHWFYAAQQPLLEQYDLQRVVDLENAAILAAIAMEHTGAFIDRSQLAHITEMKRQKQVGLEQILLPVLETAYKHAMQRQYEQRQSTYEAYNKQRQEAEKQWMHDYQFVQGTMRYAQYHAQRLAEFEKLTPCPPRPEKAISFKLSSTPQLLIALAEIGVLVENTQEETLAAVAGQHEIVPILLQWRKVQTSLNTFCSKLPHHIRTDGRIHADFHTVASGRYVTSSPNLQALPKRRDEEPDEEDPRRCVVAGLGAKLLSADLSNIELRILAEVSHDETMLRLFAEGKDLHEETARFMFQLSPETDTRKYLIQGKSARSIAKTINFGLAYGMGAPGLAGRTGVDVGTAKDLMKKYFRMYRGVDAYLRQSGRVALQRGYAVSLSGRRRYFLVSGDLQHKARLGGMERSAKNHPVQGTNADILKYALALLYKALPEGASLILAVHDELVIECREELISEVEALMKEMMVLACRQFLTEVHIPSPKVVVASYWKKDD